MGINNPVQIIDQNGIERDIQLISIINHNGSFFDTSNFTGAISDSNSTNQLLLADEIFIGEAIDVSKFPTVYITVYSDVPSATNGLVIEQSTDGENFYPIESITYEGGVVKTYTFQCFTQYLVVTYTNGSIDQTAFNLQVKLSSASSQVNLQTNNEPVNVQNPLQVNGDSIYEEDIDWDNSDFLNWIGDPRLMFRSPFSPSIINSTSDNPKILILAFKRTVSASQVGLGENNGGNFSNLKISAIGSGGAVRGFFDDEHHNEKKTSFNAPLGEDELFNSLKIEFLTSDTVSLSNITIQKSPYSVIVNGPNNPIPTSGDSIYAQDIDFLTSSAGNFEGAEISDLVEFKNKLFVDSTTDNPKTLRIDFHRPIQTNIIGIGTSSGNFSNVRISIGFGNVPGESIIFDGSTDNTKRQLLIPSIPPLTLSSVKFEFFTSDPVSLTSLGISKSIQTIARIQGQTPDGTITNFNASKLGNLKVALAEYQGDAFGRLRVSEPYTIFDNSLTTSISDTLFWSTLTNGTASGAYDRLTSKYTLSTATAGDYLVRQTKRRFKYQPGKSHMILLTGLLTTEAGQIKRIGYFDHDNVNLATITNLPQNGVLFENNAGVLSWNIYNNGTKTESITSDNWNVDKCDGTGTSGFTLDIESTNIFFMDLEWLGVGAVRVGFVNGSGEIVVCHQFQHASSGFTDVYMRTANLPISYSITSTSGAGSLKQICASVISEGGFNPIGDTDTVYNLNGVGINNGVTTLLVGIRLQAESFEYTVEPLNINILNLSNANALWFLTLNPTYASTVTFADVTNTIIQKAEGVTANTVSSLGKIIASGSFSNNSNSVIQEISSSLKIGKGLNDVTDELWLIVRSLGNDDYYGTINFKQLI